MLHIMHVLRNTGSADGGMENGVINVTNRLDPERFPRVDLRARP